MIIKHIEIVFNYLTINKCRWQYINLFSIFFYNIILVVIMTETLYFTNPNHPNYQQLIIATAFLNQNLPQEKINNKYSPLNLVTPHGVLNQPITILIYLLRDKLIG